MNEQSLFLQALEQPAGEPRQHWLDQACGDTALRARVARLLDRHEKANSFLDRPAVELMVKGDDSDSSATENATKLQARDLRKSNKQITKEKFVERLIRSRVMTDEEVAESEETIDSLRTASDAISYARAMVDAKKLTSFQARAIYDGRIRGLTLGEYVILDQLGKGGMGIVYQARHRRMDRIVAIKVLPRFAMASKGVVSRFYREVKAAAKLMHANIVAALDASEDDGLHYLVMEFVDGQDLGEILHRSGALKPEQAVDYIIQAARGLQFAHDQGVIHRDIKPANLLLDRTGTVKILDMGLARVTGAADDSEDQESSVESPEIANPSSGTARQLEITQVVSLEQETARVNDETRLTKAGEVMGTLDYMSPEQFTNSRGVDQRGDIYSLGCTLYRLLTNKRPFTEDTVGAMFDAHCRAPIPSLRSACAEIPERLEAVFQKMLAKEPAQRQASMAQVIEELEAAISTEAIVAEPPLGEPPPIQVIDPDSFDATHNFAVSASATPSPVNERYRRRKIKLTPWLAAGGAICALAIVGVLVASSTWTSQKELPIADANTPDKLLGATEVSRSPVAHSERPVVANPRESRNHAIDREAESDPLNNPQQDSGTGNINMGGGSNFSSFSNRFMTFIDNGREVSVSEDSKGITVSIEGQIITAANPTELKEKDHDAYLLYKRAFGAAAAEGQPFEATPIPSADNLQREQLENLRKQNEDNPQMKALLENMLRETSGNSN